MIFHEVDDVDHWLTSPKREEVFGPLGITIRTFVDPDTPNRVGLLAEIPDMDAYREVMASDAAADAMRPMGSAQDAGCARRELSPTHLTLACDSPTPGGNVVRRTRLIAGSGRQTRRSGGLRTGCDIALPTP